LVFDPIGVLCVLVVVKGKI